MTQIQEWLKMSELYKTSKLLNLNLHCELFDDHIVNKNLDVNDIDDFIKIMSCINHWDVDYNTWHQNIYEFMFNNMDKIKIWKKNNKNLEITQHSDFSEHILSAKSQNMINNSCRVGSINWLKYLQKNKYKLNKNNCSIAAYYGQLECLKYLHENGCEWNEQTCLKAAKKGNLKCLKYLHENGCEWTGDTCAYASYNGQFECLEYAHKNGCELNKDVCIGATICGRLKWEEQEENNKHLLDKDMCWSDKHTECLKYADENGTESESN